VRLQQTFEDQCSYKYLLNSASIGYANKFKCASSGCPGSAMLSSCCGLSVVYPVAPRPQLALPPLRARLAHRGLVLRSSARRYLLLCGSVVIYVQDGMVNKEFYEYGLLAGVHYVTAPTAADVPGVVRHLRSHDSYARSVAYAGRARIAALDVRAIAAFNAELFRQYAVKQRFRVTPLPGAVRIECEDDLWRHYARDPGFLRHYLVQDNDTCIHKISGPFRAPGYGGAYNGSKVRCIAAHDQRPGAQPMMCSPGTVVEEDQNPGEKFKHKIIQTTRTVQPGTSYASYSEFPKVGNDGIRWLGI
jgi:hypothetical protein